MLIIQGAWFDVYVNTQGNLFTHAILRGYENKHGPITGVESNLHLEGVELKCNANV